MTNNGKPERNGQTSRGNGPILQAVFAAYIECFPDPAKDPESARRTLDEIFRRAETGERFLDLEE